MRVLQKLARIWIDLPLRNRVLGIAALVLMGTGHFVVRHLRDDFLLHHRLVFEKMVTSCLPWEWYLSDNRIGQVQRGDLVTFSARNAEPLAPRGTQLTKLAIGLPGDTIEIKNDLVYVNGVYWGHVYVGSIKYHKPPGAWDRKLVLEGDEFFMLGTEPRSFDSRYWGIVKRDQFLAKLELLI